MRQAGEDGQIAGLMSDATMQHLAQRQVLRKEEVWDKFLTAYEMHRDDREQENTLEMEAARAAREKRREKVFSKRFWKNTLEMLLFLSGCLCRKDKERGRELNWRMEG